MTHSSINHLFIHTSWVSIHHWSILSCYHLPLPCFCKSPLPALYLFVYPNLNPSIQVSIQTWTFISPLWMHLSNHPFLTPSLSLPWLLFPDERILQPYLTRSTITTVPACEHTQAQRDTDIVFTAPWATQMARERPVQSSKREDERKSMPERKTERFS